MYKDITTLGRRSLDEGSNAVAFYRYLHVKWDHNKRNSILMTTMHHQKNQEPVYWKRTLIFPVQEGEAKKTYTVASGSLCIGNIRKYPPTRGSVYNLPRRRDQEGCVRD